MIRQPSRFVAVTALLLLTACGREVEVEVSGARGNPIFTITKSSPWQFAAPCLHSVRVLKSPDTNEPAIWLARSSHCHKLTHVTYGEPPNGFANDQGPARLSDGTIYLVDVAGQGWRGGQRFAWLDGQYREIDPQSPH